QQGGRHAPSAGLELRRRGPQRGLEQARKRAAVGAACAQAPRFDAFGRIEKRSQGGFRGPRAHDRRERAIEVALEHAGVYVALAADRLRVAQLPGDRLDRRGYRARRAPARMRRARLAQRLHGEQGAGPGAKVLAGVGLARGVAQVVVDVGRFDGARLALVVDVLEELLAGELLQAAHDRGERPIGNLDAVLYAALAAESKA